MDGKTLILRQTCVFPNRGPVLGTKVYFLNGAEDIIKTNSIKEQSQVVS